jgi:hypothetical protein
MTASPARLPAHVYRRRRIVALALVALLVTLVVVVLSGTGGQAADAPSTARDAPSGPQPVQLPRGGRTVIPDHRVVAYYGAPQDEELGALGIGTPDQAARRLAAQARRYARRSRPVLPALELITSLATADPGADGRHRLRQEPAVIDRYLRAARRHKMLLLLDIQGGRSDFFAEVQSLRPWLEQPDVGLALDPEWRVSGTDLPGRVIGSVSAREINAVSAWLAEIVRERDLPQKVLVVHQFTFDMVRDRERLKLRPELAIVLNADGFGGQAVKRAKYRDFTRARARGFHDGFKLFYREDTDLMRPREVLRLKPSPDLVVYE